MEREIKKITLLDRGNENVDLIVGNEHIENVVTEYEILRNCNNTTLKISIPLDRIDIKAETY